MELNQKIIWNLCSYKKPYMIDHFPFGAVLWAIASFVWAFCIIVVPLGGNWLRPLTGACRFITSYLSICNIVNDKIKKNIKKWTDMLKNYFRRIYTQINFKQFFAADSLISFRKIPTQEPRALTPRDQTLEINLNVILRYKRPYWLQWSILILTRESPH